MSTSGERSSHNDCGQELAQPRGLVCLPIYTIWGLQELLGTCVSSHGVIPCGHACGYSSRLAAGRGVGPVSQHTHFLVTTTLRGDQVSGHPERPLAGIGALITGNLG